jgi:hypothetical protein
MMREAAEAGGVIVTLNMASAVEGSKEWMSYDRERKRE